VGGYSPGQCILLEPATTTCSKTLITYITVTVPARDVQNSAAMFRKSVGRRSDSVELVPYVVSSRCFCYVHDAIYIFAGPSGRAV